MTPTPEQTAVFREEIKNLLSGVGAFCGNCGFEPGDRLKCRDCERCWDRYADALAPLFDGTPEGLAALLAESGRKTIEIERLRVEHDRDLTQVIEERDRCEEWADKLADAVGPIELIGEHSDGNNPWANALELITSHAEVERLRNQVFKLAHRQPSAQRCTECGHTGIVHRLPEPPECMADIASCTCTGWAAPCTYPDGPCVCPGTEGTSTVAPMAPEDTSRPGPERVVICGSTRYTDEMAAIEQTLTWSGVSVFAPTRCNLKEPNPLWADPAERAAGAARLAALHAEWIRDAHWVLIVGPHAGKSTRGEIAQAQRLGKTVKFTDPGLAAEFGSDVWEPAVAGQVSP